MMLVAVHPSICVFGSVGRHVDATPLAAAAQHKGHAPHHIGALVAKHNGVPKVGRLRRVLRVYCLAQDFCV